MLVVAGSMTVSSYHTVKAENEETETDVIILTPDEEHPAEEENRQEEETDPTVPQDSEEQTKKPIELTQPSAFETEAVKNGIKLSWDKVSNAQTYEIYRKVSKIDDGYTRIKTTKNCTYTDKSAKYGVTYAYKVRALTVSEEKTYKSKCSTVKRCCTYLIDPSKPMVALTFDDGPSIYTDGILDTLEKYQSRATFFEVGNRVSQRKTTVKRIHNMGCEIGNHSYDHPIMGNSTQYKINNQISTTDKKVKEIIGEKPQLFRPPYGDVGTNLKKYAGKPLILWSIDTLDWQSRNADKVYRSVMSRVKDGDIILMHDLFSSTRSAVQRIVPELKKRGYQLVTVSELAQYRNVKLTAGNRYSQMRP